MELLAQTTDPISGGAGWVGAGLLGLVLAWLFFFHLPAKDKQLMDVLTAKDLLINQMATRFSDALNSVVQHCKEDSSKLAAAFKTELTMILEAHERGDQTRSGGV